MINDVIVNPLICYEAVLNSLFEENRKRRFETTGGLVVGKLIRCVGWKRSVVVFGREDAYLVIIRIKDFYTVVIQGELVIIHRSIPLYAGRRAALL